MSNEREPTGPIDTERLQRMRARIAAVSALAVAAASIAGCERDRPPTVNSPVETVNNPPQPTINNPPQHTINEPAPPVLPAASDVPSTTTNTIATEPPPPVPPTINRPPQPPVLNQPATRRPPVPPGNG
jgi:hypothetical protein